MTTVNQKEDGFIALVSAIVISGLLIIIGASLGYTGFFSRFNILDGEFKETSLGLAESCAEIARVEIANNASFTVPAGGQSYTIDDAGNTCKILSVTGTYTVTSQAVYQKSYSTIQAVYNRDAVAGDVKITCWHELANTGDTPAPPC
ncbi:MAG TPA: hypothetical protein VHQ20_00360 [Patescibacteria group bacterium]|jgi:hypothetical protein|nr:hypothetical protein [Patescibacteria group bacterium]